MIHFNPAKWEGSYELPGKADLRWRVLAILGGFLILGITFLGFDRKPLHLASLLAGGAMLDILFSGLFKNRKMFPLSALISCCSIGLILNWSYSYINLWLPILVCIGSKYLITYKGKHLFNPSLLAVVFCIVFTDEIISLAPSYQWYGTAASSWMMLWFVLTGGLMLFYFKINRTWLVVSFLAAFTLLSIYRASLMEHIIPWETIFVGSLTSPAFYLFTFFMITDPSTSPSGKRAQVLVGVGIAVFDFLFHLKLSYYTFFFAGIGVASLRFLYIYFKEQAFFSNFSLRSLQQSAQRWAVVSCLFVPLFWAISGFSVVNKPTTEAQLMKRIPSSHSDLTAERSNLLERTDPRLHHVAKWILSVGDAAAVADVNLDGLPDLFLTQSLKSLGDRAKIHINKGDFKFEKHTIESLEPYLDNPKEYGLPGFAFFYDKDNDGDKDLFVGFGFGNSRVFENKIIPDNELRFDEIQVKGITDAHSVCLNANAADFNNDGILDILFTNTLQTHFLDYDTPTPLNIFDLPQPAYEGDRRMFRFMHESWHNANNGGINKLFLGVKDSQQYNEIDQSITGLSETRWSLASGTLDFNEDGLTDLYIANDFGRDDCYLNMGNNRFERQEGKFYGDIGLDTYKGMNVSVGDINSDGKEDIYISNVHHAMQAEGSILWINKTKKGAQKVDLVDKAFQYNALNTKRFGWGGAIGDLNMDGYPDILQANGMVDDEWDKKYDERMDYWYFQAQIARTGPEIHSYCDKWADIRGCVIYENEPDRAYINQNGEKFVDKAKEFGFNHERNTRGVAIADFDNDGDPDVLFTDQFGEPILYENTLTDKQWIGIQLKGNGSTSTADAVGSKVWVSYQQNGADKIQFKEQRLVSGFMAMGDNRLLVGLGKTSDDIQQLTVKVQWHNGAEQNLNLESWNKYLTIQQAQKNPL